MRGSLTDCRRRIADGGFAAALAEFLGLVGTPVAGVAGCPPACIHGCTSFGVDSEAVAMGLGGLWTCSHLAQECLFRGFGQGHPGRWRVPVAAPRPGGLRRCFAGTDGGSADSPGPEKQEGAFPEAQRERLAALDEPMTTVEGEFVAGVELEGELGVPRGRWD